MQLGYVSDSGLTNSIGLENANVKAWGGDTVLNTMTSKTNELKFKLIEALNPDVLKVVYGDENVTGTLETGITVKNKSLQLEGHAYVIDILMKNGAMKRIVAPEGTVTAIGDVTYKDDEVVGYDLTIGLVPDDDGVTAYEYIIREAKA